MRYDFRSGEQPWARRGRKSLVKPDTGRAGGAEDQGKAGPAYEWPRTPKRRVSVPIIVPVALLGEPPSDIPDGSVLRRLRCAACKRGPDAIFDGTPAPELSSTSAIRIDTSWPALRWTRTLLRLCAAGRVHANNVTNWPPITRQYARSVGEFKVSVPFARPVNEGRKSLI